MQTQNEAWHAIWSNGSKPGFTLLKSDGTNLIITKWCWVTLPGRNDKCIITKLFSLNKEDIGPNGMTYLPWREDEKRFASFSWSMRGDSRFIVCYPTGRNTYGQHIDWDKVYVCEPPTDITAEQIQIILDENDN